MTSYDELYCYPGTDGVLRNNFDIRDPAKLEEAEAIIVAGAMRGGLREPFEFSPDGLKAVHRQMFETLYPFAGEFRSVNLDKIGEDGRPIVSFAPGHLVERVEVPRFFNDMRKDFEEHKAFDNLDRDTFAYRASVYMADINYLHPFPEGNGRVQRVLLQEMARRSGHEMRHESISRDEWEKASIDSFGQDTYDAHGQPVKLGPHTEMKALISKSIAEQEQSKDKEGPSHLTTSEQERFARYREKFELGGNDNNHDQSRDHDDDHER